MADLMGQVNMILAIPIVAGSLTVIVGAGTVFFLVRGLMWALGR